MKRHQLQHAVQKHPRLSAAAILALSSLPGCLLAGWSELSLQRGLATHVALFGLGALLLTAFSWWGEAGFTRPSRWRNLHLTAIPLLAVLALFPSVSEVRGAQFLPYGLLALFIALDRELWFRGILFRVVVPAYGPRRAVGLTALLFGVSQSIDILGGAAPGVTLVKALAAALFGYVLGALRLRTRSIWPGVAVTAAFYATTFLARLQASGELVPSSPDRLSTQIFLALVVFLCARFWMRKAEEKHAVEAETVRAS